MVLYKKNKGGGAAIDLDTAAKACLDNVRGLYEKTRVN